MTMLCKEERTLRQFASVVKMSNVVDSSNAPTISSFVLGQSGEGDSLLTSSVPFSCRSRAEGHVQMLPALRSRSGFFDISTSFLTFCFSFTTFSTTRFLSVLHFLSRLLIFRVFFFCGTIYIVSCGDCGTHKLRSILPSFRLKRSSICGKTRCTTSR